jgi:hypothetical protein
MSKRWNTIGLLNGVPGLDVRELCPQVDLPVGGHRSAEGLHAGPSVGPELSQKGFTLHFYLILLCFITMIKSGTSDRKSNTLNRAVPHDET